MIFRRNLKMNDFENFMKKPAKAEEVITKMDEADSSEKALIAATITLFERKRKDMQKLVDATKGMDMFLNIIKAMGETKLAQLPDDIPDSAETIKHGEAVIAALDNIIEAFQKYGIARDNFNNVVKNEINVREEFKNNLENNE
jgi:hypothetical protein